jgi:hypothetical protein
MGSAAAALASLRSAADSCTRDAVRFTEQERANGMVIVDELRALFANTGRPARHAAERHPSLLQDLPPELLLAVIRRLDSRSLARLASTCRVMWADRPRPMSPVEEVLRQRAAERPCDSRVPPGGFQRVGALPAQLRRRGGCAFFRRGWLCPQPLHRP